MAGDIFLSIPALTGIVLFVLFWIATRAYFRFRGPRIVTCPETMRPAVVEVNAKRAARTAPFGEPVVEVKSCSEWPDRGDCDRACGDGIAAAPADSKIRKVVANWYANKRCVLCRKSFGNPAWLEHEPALIDPYGRLLTLDEIPVRDIPDVLSTHSPVCWDCRMADLIRRNRPDLFGRRTRRPLQ